VFYQIGEGLTGANAIAGGEAVTKENEMFLRLRLKGGGQEKNHYGRESCSFGRHFACVCIRGTRISGI